MTSREEMLIERSKHMCNSVKYPEFVQNFKLRYQAFDDSLLKNVCVSLFLREDTFNHEFIRDFMHRISQPVPDELVEQGNQDKAKSLANPRKVNS